MKRKARFELVEIAHRLSVDTLVLYAVGGTGFLLAETVLPGIFSQRVNFFWFFLGFFACMGIVAGLGMRVRYLTEVSCEKEIESDIKPFFSSRRQKISFGVFVFLAFGCFFLPVMRNVSSAALFLSVVSGVAASVTVLYLLFRIPNRRFPD